VMSIRARTALYGLMVVTIVLTLFSCGVLALFWVAVSEGQDEELRVRAQRAAEQLADAPGEAFVPAKTPAPTSPAVDNEIFVVVMDSGGAVLGGTPGPAPALPESVRSAAGGRGTTATLRMGDVPVRAHVIRWERADLGKDGYVMAAQTTRREQIDRRGIAALVIVSLVITLGAAAVAIWLVTVRALRPLRQLASTADEIGQSQDLSRRLPAVPRNDDLGRLTWSFNRMLDRLQEAYRRTADALVAQQRFTADASHELRTPLTSIRNNAGFLSAHDDATPEDRAAALADIEAEGARMSRLVNDLLTLARADAGQRPELSAVDVGELADDVCRRAASQHADRRIRCAGTPTVVQADADAVTQLLWILLDNAVAHTEADGNVWVAVTSLADGGARMQVADDGEGIPPGEEQRIFDRFYRGESSRGREGAGLGLSIAGWIASAHAGTISAAGNERGGATFTVELGRPSSGSSSSS
jgi:two-component system OmpR family sensor kinase